MSSDDPDYFPPESEEFAVRQLHDINWIVSFFVILFGLSYQEKLWRRCKKTSCLMILVIYCPECYLFYCSTSWSCYHLLALCSIESDTGQL
jgi:hypothetical protein